MNNYLIRLKSLTKNSDNTIVCFDFFDTIVSRLLSAEEVKKSWAKHCSKYCYDNSICWERVYRIRRSFEKKLYENKEVNYEFNYGELLKLIYDKICSLSHVSFSIDSFYDFYVFSLNCEEMIELESQYINNDVFELIEYCRNHRIKMVVVSDFYLGKTSLYKFLKKYNIELDFSKIFVSCDYHKSKKIGDIFEVVKEEYPNNDYIMIGDNQYVDINISQKFGFKGILINRKKRFASYQYYDDNSKFQIYKKLYKISQEKKLFLSNYAFTLYLFIERLFNKTQENNIEDLYFFSRDGQFLQILFDLYIKKRPFVNRVKSHYLMVSRNSTYLPACKPIDEENFDGIFSHYEYIKLEDFLLSISFNKRQIDDVFSEMGCKRGFAFSKNDSSFINKLKNSRCFRLYYETNRRKNKAIFLEYLQQEIADTKQFTIVDVGWRGTIQDNLFFTITPEPKITGYYYGIQELHNIRENNQKNGLIFSCDRKTEQFFDTYEFEYWFVENILTGNHGKVVGYRKTKGIISAELQQDSDGRLYCEYIRELREEIIKMFQMIDNLFLGSHYFATDYAELFSRIHFQTTRLFPIYYKKDSFTIRKLHSEGFGLVLSNEHVCKKGWQKYFVNNYGSSYIKSTYKDFKANIIFLGSSDIIVLFRLKVFFLSAILMQAIYKKMDKIKKSVNNNKKRICRKMNRIYKNETRNKKLENKTISVIASNCNGALILHDLGVRFNSPFVNLWIKPKDFLKLLKDFDRYMAAEMTETTEEGIKYPVGKLDDVTIYFQHYESFEQAKEKWDERKKRIDKTNLFVLFSDRDGCTYEDLVEFDSLPYNKVVFTNKPYPEIKSSFYIKGFETLESVGHCYEYMPGKRIKYYDQFDYVKWFNEGVIKRKRYGLLN